MTIADYQAQTAANLEKLREIKLDLSVLEPLEESEEAEDFLATSKRPTPYWLSFAIIAAAAGTVGMIAGVILF